MLPVHTHTQTLEHAHTHTNADEQRQTYILYTYIHRMLLINLDSNLYIISKNFEQPTRNLIVSRSTSERQWPKETKAKYAICLVFIWPTAAVAMYALPISSAH